MTVVNIKSKRHKKFIKRKLKFGSYENSLEATQLDNIKNIWKKVKLT